ncbi:unknown [Clostridium clostridioforme CAG:132]|uniref:Uncharacterized protein n=1 Tax=[Clostridium] clostridioforme CAG:132 TaxID=1263065 RepID=R6JUM2_9FIRM|nr:unknown [[Clostridium] clostridioforme CAG:132]
MLPIGRRLLLRMKSSRSRTVLPSPRGAKLPQRLKPSTHGTDRMMMAAILQRTAFLRVHPVKSVANEMMFWNTAMMVEKAAKDINRKNSVPQILPPAIWLNTLGRVMKIRDGPAVDSIL